FDEAHFVRRYERRALGGRELHGPLEILRFARPSESLALDIEPRRHQPAPVAENLARMLESAADERLAELSVLSARECDEPFERRRFEPLAQDERAALRLGGGVAGRQQATQVAEAVGAGAEKREPVRVAIVMGVGRPYV